MKKLILILFLMFFCSIIYGFDGKKKVFLLELGTGINITSYAIKENKNIYISNTEIRDSKNQTGFNINYKIGYAPNNLLEIYFLHKNSVFITDEAGYKLGILGIGLSKYIKETPVFVSGGIGISTFHSYSSYQLDLNYKEDGLAYFLGSGIDINKNFNLEFDLLYGNYSDLKKEINSEWELNSIILMLSMNIKVFLRLYNIYGGI